MTKKSYILSFTRDALETIIEALVFKAHVLRHGEIQASEPAEKLLTLAKNIVAMAQEKAIVLKLPPDLSDWRAHAIIGEALAHAVEAIDSLPVERRPASNRDDMVAIFQANWSEGIREMLMRQVEVRTGHAPDMTNWKTSSATSADVSISKARNGGD
jgi:hypothetical protein